ncbi:MAG TPA: hypothetical protein VFA79_15345 [Myxococcales bacterium]|nr:hypothetical protein [Myxococcales bacterium]
MGSLVLAALIAIAPRVHEGDAQAFTAVVDAASGSTVADGRYAQQVSGDVLHIEARYDFADGRTVVERAAVRLHPQLEQESWDWTERKGDALVRKYEVDFRTGQATAIRVDQHKEWKEHLDDIEAGKTFAGIAFVTVIKTLREELKPGQKVQLKAVAFTPKPRVATVDAIRDKPEELRMAGRSIPADAYTIHPDVPAIAKLFVKAPDQHVWLFATGPAAFLRYQGPLVEPKDPVIRVDLIPSRSANEEKGARQAR